MDKFVIHGGHRLSGEIEVSGAKNAAVALIPAVLLCDEPCILENVPDISDVSISLRIMQEMGAQVEYLNKTTVRISAAGLTNYCVPYECFVLLPRRTAGTVRQGTCFHAGRMSAWRPPH